MNKKGTEYQRRAEQARLTWEPVKGGKRAWVCFDDFKIYDLGPDPSGTRFKAISERFSSGHYYPNDALEFDGRYAQEGRDLQVGDRIIQRAPLFGKLGGPRMFCASDIFVAEYEAARAKIGYVTTDIHFARGIWSAELARDDGNLKLTVQSTASPGSWLYWLGLPYARFLQLRARKRAVQVFKAV